MATKRVSKLSRRDSRTPQARKMTLKFCRRDSHIRRRKMKYSFRRPKKPVKPFRLWDLPYLARKEIIRQLDIERVIGLWCISKFFKRELQLIKLPCQELQVQLTESKCSLKLTTYPHTSEPFGIDIPGVDFNKFFDEMFFEFMAFLDLRNANLEYANSQVDLLNSRIYLAPIKWTEIQITGEPDKRPPADQLRQILQNMKASRFFSMFLDFSQIPIGFLSYPEISINNAIGLRFEQFDPEVTESIQIFESRNMADQLNGFLKMWINGGLSKLERLAVFVQEEQLEGTVLEGVKAVEDIVDHGGTPLPIHQISRKTDGACGIAVFSGNGSRVFRFFVDEP